MKYAKYLLIALVCLAKGATDPKGRDEEFWSFEKLPELCFRRPADAWEVIVKIYEQGPGEWVLSNLAAGPLEDLLVNHGSSALVWIDQYVATAPGFRNLLGTVWKNAISEEVWAGLNLIKNRA